MGGGGFGCGGFVVVGPKVSVFMKQSFSLPWIKVCILDCWIS